MQYILRYNRLTPGLNCKVISYYIEKLRIYRVGPYNTC